MSCSQPQRFQVFVVICQVFCPLILLFPQLDLLQPSMILCLVPPLLKLGVRPSLLKLLDLIRQWGLLPNTSSLGWPCLWDLMSANPWNLPHHTSYWHNSYFSELQLSYFCNHYHSVLQELNKTCKESSTVPGSWKALWWERLCYCNLPVPFFWLNLSGLDPMFGPVIFLLSQLFSACMLDFSFIPVPTTGHVPKHTFHLSPCVSFPSSSPIASDLSI